MSNKKLSPRDLEILGQKAVEAVIVHGMSKNKHPSLLGFLGVLYGNILKSMRCIRKKAFDIRSEE